MRNCNEFDPTMVECIEAYPMSALPVNTFAYEHISAITSEELNLAALSSQKRIVPMSDKPNFESSDGMERPGRIYSINIEVPCGLPSDAELAVIEQIESEPHVLVIKCFPDNFFIAVPSIESYYVGHSLKDGSETVSIKCKNMSGIIPYIVLPWQS